MSAETAEVALRLSSPNDLEALRSISAVARARYRSIPALAFVADAPPLDAARFAVCRTMVAYAVDEQKILGFAASRPLDGLLYLDNISVSPELSRAGVGDMLLRETLQHAQSEGFPAVALTTFRMPRWNGPWFRRYGFQPMPEHEIGTGLRTVMERQALSLDPAIRETLRLATDDPL